MGSSLSVCGLGASHDDASSSKQHPRAFEREKVMELLAHNDRTRTLSVTTDTSVASILSNSDRLIPDAFMPVDIQVVSQRRVRPTSSSVLLQQSQSQSSHAHGSTTPSKTSSHYYANSAQANAAFLRYMTSSTSATTSESVPMTERVSTKRKQVAGESYYASYADDDESGLLSSRSSRRSGNHSHLSTRDLVKGF